MKNIYILTLFLVLLLGSLPVFASDFESNTDRPGLDYNNFDLKKANPSLCATACEKDSACKAWTYVKPKTIQGPRPRCWLKNAVPSPVKHKCCISGVKKIKPDKVEKGMEMDTDRPGRDYKDFNLSKAKPEECKKSCLKESACKAWTYVKPNTIQGPRPRCWLKNAVPPPVKQTCCVSGVK